MNEPANLIMMLISHHARQRVNETKSNAMPTYHRVARAAQPPSDATPELAALPGAGDISNDRAVIGTNMRTGDDQPAGTPTDLASSSGRKRSPAASPLPGTLHYQGDTTEDETGSINDGQPPTKKRPRRTKKVAQKRIRRVTASPSPEAPPDPATAAAAPAAATASNSSNNKKENIKKVKRTVEMILSSSSSEDDSSDDEQAERKVSATANENVGVNAGATTKMDYSDDDISYSDIHNNENGGSDAEMKTAIAESLRMHQERQGKRSKSSGGGNSTGPGSGGGWLRSFHTSIGGGQGSDSDDDSSSDDDDDLDDRLAAISRRNWLSSATRDAKLDHMAKISNDADRILQMLLWDVGFDYHIYPHQFEAIRFVAGLESTFPLVRHFGKKPTERGQPDSSDDSSSDDEEDESIQDMLRLDSAGASARSNALRSAPLLPTRGMLLADEMGLGKTIESLAGAALRNVMQQCTATSTVAGDKKRSMSASITPRKKSSRQLPVLIVVPQDGILGQWEETLRKAGVEPARIKILGERKRDTKKRSPNKRTVKGGIFILCTRYKVQSEMRRLFDCSTTADLQANQKKSDLFPNVSTALIKKLCNQYLSEKGKERNKCIRKKEARPDCVARLIRESFRGGDGSSLKAAFHTVIVDEAHFVKNLLAYWGMGVALLGAQSKRTVLCTGTPFNNGPQDMSALMTFIDPCNEASRIKWWEEATNKGEKARVVEAVSSWRKTFMIRRTKDILQNKLPPRIRETIDVGSMPCELAIYEAYEYNFLNALNQLQEEMEDGSPESRRRMKELFDIMMACIACMRMSLVHPMLPGGRELTIQFSPTRRHLLKREERPKHCVFCSEKYPSEVAKIFADIKAGCRDMWDEEIQDMRTLGLDGHVRAEMDLDDDELDDEDLLEDKGGGMADKKKGPLIELSADICQASGSDCCHFGHEKCLKLFLEGEGEPEGGSESDEIAADPGKKESSDTIAEKKLLDCPRQCPRCSDLKSRLRIIDPTNPDGKPPHATYCEEISTTIDSTFKGFTASAKIEEAVKWFQKSVPKSEKAIILSFFKGSLDLMEGILSTELGLECVRYDGDVDKEVRAKDLERFKKSESCRVLLATVQSGGTGLNITEANNVLFLDRWFNPCVHDQAESRCHRIGQAKPVKIAYLDNVLTVDVVMKRVNALKEDNAGVLLADGTSLGETQWSLGYQNLSGVIGSALKAVRDLRRSIIEMNIASGNGNAPLPTGQGTVLETQLEEKMAARASNKKAPRQIKMERKVKAEVDEEKKDDDDDTEGIGQKAPHFLKRFSSSRSIASSSDDSDDDELLGGSPIFGPKSKSKKVAFRRTSLGAGESSSSDDDDLLNCSPTFRKQSENKDTSNYSLQTMGDKATESTSRGKMESGLVKVELDTTNGDDVTDAGTRDITKKSSEDDIIELLSSDSEDEGTNGFEMGEGNSEPSEKPKESDKNSKAKPKTTDDEEDDPGYQQASYESMNETSTKTNEDDFDDGDRIPTCKTESDDFEMSSEELMQAMNQAMKNGDKRKAQELLKRWEASLSC